MFLGEPYKEPLLILIGKPVKGCKLCTECWVLLEMLSLRQGATHWDQGIILGDNLMYEKEKKCDSVEFLKDVN